MLAVLTGYALASTVPAATGQVGLELHDLVRAAVRARDRAPAPVGSAPAGSAPAGSAPAGPAPDPLALALRLLRVDASAEIHGSPRSSPRWAALIPHVLAATSHVGWQLAPTALEDAAWLLDRAAAYLHVQGRLPEAKALHERALVLDEAIYGPDHPGVAMRLETLAQILREPGQLE